MSVDERQILQPKPQRPKFSTSPLPSEPSSPTNEALLPKDQSSQNGLSMERTRSVLNLTASTLYGIYAPDDDTSVFGYTPMPTNGATTPAYPPTPSSISQYHFGIDSSVQDRANDRMAPVIGALEMPQFRAVPAYQRNQAGGSVVMRMAKGLIRAFMLFVLGVAYGTVVTHLHDARNVAPVKLDSLDRTSPRYALFWGIAGIVLGTALPVVDAIWKGEGLEEKRERLMMQKSLNGNTFAQQQRRGGDREADSAGATGTSPLAEAVGLGAEWNPMVRSIGAFVGIGFAIRRLPWQSTLQASLTLGLVNPCLWYTIDRSLPGLAVSAAVGILGTTVLLGTEVVPMPAVVTAANKTFVNGTAMSAAEAAATAAGPHGSMSPAQLASHVVLGIDQGTLAIWVWISSVLFCSSLCFGNIGRRLALGMNER